MEALLGCDWGGSRSKRGVRRTATVRSTERWVSLVSTPIEQEGEGEL